MDRARGAASVIVRTGLTGPAPRSEALISATRDLDRGRTTPEAVEELFAAAERDVAALERRLGFESVSGGYLRWSDLFRPIAETWEGFAVGPLTRWLETNTFFRQPILLAPPGRAPGALAARLPPVLRNDPTNGRVFLPGPYTFALTLDNRSGETDESVIHRLGRLLADEVRELRALGFTTFLFSEPLLAIRPPESTRAEAVVAGYQSVKAAIGGGTSIVWTYGADGIPAFPVLDRLPVSAVGVDLAETEVERLPASPHRIGLGLGVVDPRTTLGEDPAEVARVVRMAHERRRPTMVWLGPGAPLDLLPWEPATKKLHVLPAVSQVLGDGGRS
jgi:5-methyltetrahydropteroyltriglutamate--homocysteine methyltransferase